MKKVGLVAALKNGQWAEGFPQLAPETRSLPIAEQAYQAVEDARNHVQNVFSNVSAGFGLQETLEETFDVEPPAHAANDEMWDTPYGFDDTSDLEHTTETRNHDDLTTHNYTVATLGTAPSLSDVSSGHSDSDITEKNGRAKVGNASQDGWDIVQKKRAEQAFTSIYMNQRLKDQTREQTRFMLERLKEARDFLASMSDEDLDTNNTDVESVAKRERLRIYLEEFGLDVEDYIKDDGHIDRERIDRDIEAREAQLFLAEQGLSLDDYRTDDGSIDRDKIKEALDAKANEYKNANDGVLQAYAVQGTPTEIDTSNLMGTPMPTHAFNNGASVEADGNNNVENEASNEIADKDPQEAANEILASLGFSPETSANSMENDAFTSTASIPATDNDGFESVASIPAADNGGFESVASIPAADNGGFESVADLDNPVIDENDYDSISVAEAVTATDQPQEVSLLPPGEWKNMEISTAFQEQSFATESTLAEAANEPVYNTEGTYGNADPAAVVGVKVA